METVHDNKPRVLLVSPIGEIGGGERVLVSLAKHLPSFGFEPIFVSMRPGPLVKLVREMGIEVHEYVPHRYREIHKTLRGGTWLAEVIRRTGANLVHVNHSAHLYGALACGLAGVPEVWHLHDYPYAFDWITSINMWLRPDCVIFTTSKVKSGFPILRHCPGTVIAPACVEAASLRAIVPAEGVRSRFGLPDGPLCLTVARLQEHKGHRYLLKAIPSILASYPDAVFAIAGKPSEAMQERYFGELRCTAEDLGISERVKFLGFVTEEELAGLYQETACLIHPALSEGFGLVLLEAMVFGVPVIVAAADGPRELIQDGVSGLLIQPGDSASLAEAVIRLLSSPSLARELRENSARLIEKYNVKAMVEATCEVYRRALSKRGRGDGTWNPSECGESPR